MTTGEKIYRLRRQLNLTQEQLADLLNVTRQAVSRWEGDISLPESDKLLSLREALNKINDKERVVIMKRYYYGMSQSEIADELSISQAQVSRIENSAINSVKKLIM